MKIFSTLIITIFCCFFSFNSFANGSFKINKQIHNKTQNIKKAKPTTSLLFVINSSKGSLTKEKITFNKVSDTVLYFSDRPERLAGHVSLEKFLEYWNNSPDNFAKNAPNAVISITEDNENYNNIVITLKNPFVKGNTLSFDIQIIEGTVPENDSLKFENDPLFIDGGFPCFVIGC